MLREWLIALGVTLLGIALAFVIRWGLRLLARRYAERAPWLEHNAFDRGPWRIPIEAVFWAIIVAATLGALRFVSSAPLIASLVDALLVWLPRVLIAFVAVSVGVIGGRLLRNLMRHLGTSPEREGLARLAEGGVVLFSLLIALGSLGLHVTWLAEGLAGITIAAVAALFLVLALGTVPYMENLIALRVIAPRLAVGDRVKIGDVEGRVLELTASAIVLETENGLAHVPGRQLQQVPMLILHGTEERDA